jgi:hypothetical protein
MSDMADHKKALGIELYHAGAEARHAKLQLDAAIAATEPLIRQAYEAGMSVDEVVDALGGPLP